MEDSNVQSPDRIAPKQPLDVSFVLTADGRVNYEQTWPELRAKACAHQNRLVSTFHAMAHTMVMEDEAKRKLYGRVGGAAARLTAEELEKVFGGDQGAAWVPTTGTKGPRSFREWILRTQELCKKALVKTKHPPAGDIVHCAIGATDHYQGLVDTLSMTAIDEANNIMCDSFIKALGQHQQFDGVLTTGTEVHRIIAKWRSDGEVPETCIIDGRFRPENVPVIALFREFAATCMESASMYQGDLFASIVARDELEPLDEAIEGMTKAADTLKEKWTDPKHHDLINEMMATSVIVKVNQMSKIVTDVRVKHVLWTAWQAMQTDAKTGAGTLTMKRLLPAINALNQQVLDEKLVLPGTVGFQRKKDAVCETPAETPARLTGVKRGTMDEDIEIDASDHVEEANSLRLRMTAERQQELLLSEARETLRNHAILSNKKRKAKRAKHGKPRIPIEALRKAFGH
jgi:hypothetical protein